MTRVDVDLNSRTWEGLVRAGFEDAGEPVAVGQHVLAWQSDDELIADAIVERIDVPKRLTYLRVKWDTLREDDQSAGFSVTVYDKVRPAAVLTSVFVASQDAWRTMTNRPVRIAR